MTAIVKRELTSVDEARWAAVRRGDAGGGAPFVYAVCTTGIYCRPGCASRQPRRENVRFFDTPRDAEREGFRACKRCRPEATGTPDHLDGVREACRTLATTGRPPAVETLAQVAGLSATQFRRVFRAMVGVTPRQYHAAVRRCALQDGLDGARPVTAAIRDAGFTSASRVYEQAEAMLGMTPSAYRRHGARESIRCATGPCFLGRVLVAVTTRGVCAILLGDDDEDLVTMLGERFRAADIEPDEDLAEVLSIVVHFIECPALGLALPLDIRGTAFQQQVWQALQAIPAGVTTSYGDIARALGRSQSSRAVAQACAANTLAVAVPCHRVVTGDGRLSGYRWGVDRKRTLLERELQ